MPISFGTAVAATPVDGASVSIGKPAGVAAGDDLIACIVTQGNGIAAASGWAQVVTRVAFSGAAPCRLTILRRRLTAADDPVSSYSFSGGETNVWRDGIIIPVFGGSTGALVNIAEATAWNSDTTPTSPSVTPTIPNGTLLAVGAVAPTYDNLGQANISSVPAGTTDRGYTGASYACCRAASADLASADPTATYDWAGSGGGSSVGATLVLSDNSLPTAPTNIGWDRGNPDDTAGVIAAGEDNTLRWTHNDPDGDAEDDAQVRYRQQGTTPWTTVARTGPGYYTLPAGTLPAAVYEQQVRTADTDDWGAWSESTYVTVATRPAAPTIDDPGDTDTITGPTATVTLSGLTGSHMQVRVRNLAQTVTHDDSGTIPATISHVAGFPAATSGTEVRLEARQRATGLWSPWAATTPDVAYEPPPTAIVAGYPTARDYTVAWTIPDPTGGQPDPVEVRIHRRTPHPVTGEWAETRRVAVGLDPDDGAWVDHAVAHQQAPDYSVEILGDTGATSLSEWANSNGLITTHITPTV